MLNGQNDVMTDEQLRQRYAKDAAALLEIQLCLHTLRKEGVVVTMTIAHANEQLRDIEFHVGINWDNNYHVFEGYPTALEWLQDFVERVAML